ncbi:hypothetical protein PHLGIDRAFT_167308 [Phlebiopsis gigantea 11061_1 CR5-6]|uniref:Uncharacterized protein n=1 Tax=Phlebiopsis gigantea (strain 11061_1 CR5-6) TaxID=745531 RepID=A0A0C3RV57_PHLG1|nr:hypothetical protein PHLGIDRAFT_167308 [Phlebiopsis gigantea 11061_1 CR5-6]
MSFWLIIFTTFLTEAVVLGIVLTKLGSIRKYLKSLNIDTSLGILILQEGTIFSVAFLSLEGLSALSTRYPTWSNVPAVIDTLISILISRFIMHLRDIRMARRSGDKSAKSLELPIDSASTIVQSPPSALVGNLGAPLDIEFLQELYTESEAQTKNHEGSIEQQLNAPQKFESVSNDPLTIGIVLYYSHVH